MAANVRARIAWMGLSGQELADKMGWKQRTVSGKLRGAQRFNEEELVALAQLFGLADPGPLYRVPETFTAPALEESSQASSLWDVGWSGHVHNRATLVLPMPIPA